MPLTVPNCAEDIILQYILNKSEPEDLIIRLYSNDISPDRTDVIDTYVEVTGGGYAAINLTPESWDISLDNPTQAGHRQVTFTFTGSIGNVYGYYIARETGGELMWAERFSNGPYNIQNNGDEIRVTPKITLE